MREELFEELLESIKQGGAILRGEMKPSRVFEYDQPERKSISSLKRRVSNILQKIPSREVQEWDMIK